MKTLIGIIAAAALTVSAPLATARDFRSADIHPADYPTVEAVKFLGKQLATASGGKLGVKVFPNGALGSEKDTIEQLKIGALDMMRINASPLNNFVPETIALCLPFIFRDTQHMRTVLDGPIGDEILASMAPAGLVGLAYYDSGARSIYTVKAPVKSLADLKGLKIRVQQSDLWVGMIQSLGANPTPMPYGEVYTALKTGLVDAAENNWPSYESSRHFEAAKFYNVTEHSLAPEVLVMSKTVWDALSKEDQAMIRKAAKESVPVMRKLWDEREQASRKTVEAAGVQVIAIANKAEFVDAMKPVYAKFAGDEKLQSLVKRIQDTK